jgi:hypothetical protein
MECGPDTATLGGRRTAPRGPFSRSV